MGPSDRAHDRQAQSHAVLGAPASAAEALEGLGQLRDGAVGELWSRALHGHAAARAVARGADAQPAGGRVVAHGVVDHVVHHARPQDSVSGDRGRRQRGLHRQPALSDRVPVRIQRHPRQLLHLHVGAIGVGAGVLATLVYASSRGWAVVVPTVAWAGGIGAAMAIGALAGILPALRAARMSPTESLRTA